MLKGFAAGLVALALAATPAAAANVSGWYAGIYGGASHAGDVEFGYDDYFAQLVGPGTIEVPSSYVNNGLDPNFFDFLNMGPPQFPFADLGAGIAYLTDGTLKLTPGATVGVVVGYGFGNGLRVEGDVSAASFGSGLYTTVSMGEQDALGGIDGAGVWTWDQAGDFPDPVDPPMQLSDLGFTYTNDVQFLLLNAFYDIDTGSAFTPYLGGGLGVARITTTLDDTCGCVTGMNTRLAPAAQLGGGLRIALSEPISLDFGYRYKVTGDQGFSALDAFFYTFPYGAYEGSAVNTSGIIGVHTLQAGLTFALP
jgi:opacity protein-like surface antigen